MILFYEMWDNCSFKYRIMPPRRRPPCDFNHDPHPNENGEGELPPPPPPPPYNDGIHLALIQFIVDPLGTLLKQYHEFHDLTNKPNP
jgi:hypothetical protein